MSHDRQVGTTHGEAARLGQSGELDDESARDRARELSASLMQRQFPVQKKAQVQLQSEEEEDGAQRKEGSPGEGAQEGPQGLKSPLFQGIDSLLKALLGTRFLRRGCSDSAAVVAIQQALAGLGQKPGTADGIWGPKTDGAVRGFQSQKGLSVDGIIGPQTMSSLDEEAGSGPPKKDPVMEQRIGYNAYRNAQGQAVDPEREGIDTTLDWLPFNRDGSGWDHRAILSHWSQVDFDPGNLTTTDEVRCSTNVAMSARIIEGPEALVAWANAVQAKGAALMNTVSPERQARIQQSSWLLGFHAQKILMSVNYWKSGGGGLPMFATWDDLDKISHHAKLILTERALGFASNSELQDIHTLGSGHSREINVVGMQITSRAQMVAVIANIRPGESYMVAIDFHTGEGYDLEDKTQIDHVINIGREPIDKGGKSYLYDSNPKKGSQLRYLLEDGAESEEWFWPYFEAAGQRDVFKQTRIMAATML